jgi:hypothetical protein
MGFDASFLCCHGQRLKWTSGVPISNRRMDFDPLKVCSLPSQRLPICFRNERIADSLFQGSSGPEMEFWTTRILPSVSADIRSTPMNHINESSRRAHVSVQRRQDSFRSHDHELLDSSRIFDVTKHTRSPSVRDAIAPCGPMAVCELGAIDDPMSQTRKKEFAGCDLTSRSVTSSGTRRSRGSRGPRSEVVTPSTFGFVTKIGAFSLKAATAIR